MAKEWKTMHAGYLEMVGKGGKRYKFYGFVYTTLYRALRNAQTVTA